MSEEQGAASVRVRAPLCRAVHPSPPKAQPVQPLKKRPRSAPSTSPSPLSSGDPKTTIQTWIRGLYNGMLQYYDGGCYQGYWDPDVEDWGDAYYGANFHQLRVVKSAYDPQNVFRFQRSIPPI